MCMNAYMCSVQVYIIQQGYRTGKAPYGEFKW